MNDPRRYRYDDPRTYRPNNSRRGSRYAPARRVDPNVALPATVMVVGLIALVAVLLCAAAGVFSDNTGAAVLGTSHPGASHSLRSGDQTRVQSLLRRQQIDRLLNSMTTEDKVGQLLLLRSHNLPDEEFCSEITDTHAGGVVLFADDVKGKTAEQLTDYILQLQTASDGRMLICVDEEGGTVVRVSSNRKLRDRSFASPQKLYAEGGMERISSDATEKARFLHRFGFNVNFAPVADVVTEPKAMMYRRAFGLDAESTAEYVRTVVTASEREGVGACLKHFPGYGNTSGDTHNGVVTLDTSLDELRARDLLPFAAGIDAGCGAVMITHTVMTAIDPDHPASMSPAVVSLLRDEMGFEGVTVSDGMDMGAIKPYSGGRNVCVAAFLAGVDLMCTPGDGRAAFAALLEAVNDGTIAPEKLDEAVARILTWKQSLGLLDSPVLTAEAE